MNRGRISCTVGGYHDLIRMVEHSNSPSAHDHLACGEDVVRFAATAYLIRDARLTDLRKQVLQLAWSSDKPIGTYYPFTPNENAHMHGFLSGDARL